MRDHLHARLFAVDEANSGFFDCTLYRRHRLNGTCILTLLIIRDGGQRTAITNWGRLSKLSGSISMPVATWWPVAGHSKYNALILSPHGQKRVPLASGDGASNVKPT
jgi:hypothetical protein